MVVVGSGAIGSEFAFLYASLGVKVTVVEYMPQFMPLLDAEVSAAAERAFRRQRITVMCDTAVKGVSVVDGKCVVKVEQKGAEKEILADKVLSAVGIKSNIEGLGLVLIKKQEVNSKTETSVYPLDRAGRIAELSRILGGIAVTDAQRKAAEDMLDEREKYSSGG